LGGGGEVERARVGTVVVVAAAVESVVDVRSADPEAQEAASTSAAAAAIKMRVGVIVRSQPKRSTPIQTVITK
jgi:hypothetical protein